MLEDDDAEKWRWKEQTEVKHELLKKYIKPWFNKISTLSREIHYIDGFAGRGEYEDGSIGSPLLAMDAVNAKFEHENADSKVDAFRVYAVEKNESNFEDLQRRIEKKNGEVHPKIHGEAIPGEFGEEAKEYIRKNSGQPEPCFIFIDPFGFQGVPLDIVAQLMNLRGTGIEVFITFMSGKMAQFLTSETHQQAMDAVFGTADWRDHVEFDAEKEERAEQLMLFYERQLRLEADIEYVWPFQMYEEGKRQTAYYLIHATNHFEGFKLMKNCMFSIGAKGKFAYLGPDHYKYEDDQEDLFSFSNGSNNSRDEILDDIQSILIEKYAGETHRFGDIVKELYLTTPYVESQMRDAALELADGPDAEITNRPDRPEGNSDYGLGLGDDIEFTGETQSSIDRWS